MHKTTRAWHRFEDTAALAAHEASDMSLAHISVLDEARYFALARMLEVRRAARASVRPPLPLTGLALAQILTRSEQLSLKLRSFTDVLGSGGRMAVAAETLQPWRTVVTIEPTERQQMEATAMASAHRQRREKLAHEARQIAGKRRATTNAARSRGEVEVIKGSALNQSWVDTDVAFIDLTRMPHTDEGVLMQALTEPIAHLQAGSFVITLTRWEKMLLPHDTSRYRKLAAEKRTIDAARGEFMVASLFRLQSASIDLRLNPKIRAHNQPIYDVPPAVLASLEMERRLKVEERERKNEALVNARAARVMGHGGAEGEEARAAAEAEKQKMRALIARAEAHKKKGRRCESIFAKARREAEALVKDDDSEFDADEGGLGNAQITADAAAPAPRRTLRSSTQLPVVPAATKEPLLRGARSAGSLLFAGI